MTKTIKNLIILGAFVLSLGTFGVSSAQTTALPNATDAMLNASVNPNGTATSAWFEYGTDVNMYYISETPHIYMGSAYGEVPLSQKIMNLTPNTVYFYRAVANNGTVVKGNILSFTTTSTNVAPVYTYTNNNVYTNTNPYVNTTASTYNYNDGVNITNITATGAILNATLTNPNRNSAEGYFEWGPTNSFGNTTAPTNLGTAYSSNFSGTLTGLNPNTTYYFRAVAVLNGKVIRGSTKSFQTYGTTVTNVNNFQAPTVTTNQGQLITTPVNTNTNYTTTNPILSANAISSGAFLPNNLFGWLLLLIIILAILWAVRKLSQPTTYVVERPANHH